MGVSYEIPGYGEITAVAPVAVDLTTLKVDVQLESTSTPGPAAQVCCNEPLDSCGRYQCFRAEESLLTYGLRLVALPDRSSQEGALRGTEARLIWSTSAGESGVTEWSLVPSTSISQVAEEYCGVVELRNLIDGSTRIFPEVCRVHAGRPEPGDTEPLPAEADAQRVSACASPIEGYEEKWCEGSLSRCDDGDTTRCSTMLDYCDPPLEPGTGGTDSGIGGDSGAGALGSGTAGAPEEDPKKGEDAYPGAPSTSTCAYRAPSAPNHALALLSLLGLAAWASRRRAP